MPDPILRTVARLLLLAAAGIPVFAGFGMPFVLPGATGFALGSALVLGGAGLLWWIERRTRGALESDTVLNRTLKADGDNLTGPD